MNRDSLIAARRAALMKQRAERQDPDDLPGNLTQRERNAYIEQTLTLDRQIAAFNTAVETWAALPNPDVDTTWLAHLNEFRQTLCDELVALPPRIRDRAEITRQQNLAWAIKFIDFGDSSAKLPIVDLSSTRLGELMHASGYATSGPELRGPRGWRGSIKEVERRIKDLTRQRAAAEATLDALLRTDDEQAKVNADTQAFYAALATMTIKGNATGDGLVAARLDGEPLPVENMTPAQKAAFERFAAAAHPQREATTA